MWNSLLPTLAGKTLREHDRSGMFGDLVSTITGFRMDDDYVAVLTVDKNGKRGEFGARREYLGVAVNAKDQLKLVSPWFEATIEEPALPPRMGLVSFAQTFLDSKGVDLEPWQLDLLDAIERGHFNGQRPGKLPAGWALKLYAAWVEQDGRL